LSEEKGERIAPLFLTREEAFSIIDEYCVEDWDEPLTNERVETIVASLVPQLWLAPAEGEGAFGATRLGGAPDMAIGRDWPLRAPQPERAAAAAAERFSSPWVVRQLREEVPFEFVGQIDLVKASGNGIHANGLPETGQLLFFLDMAVLMGTPDASVAGCLVIHDNTARENLERQPVPARFDDMERWWRTLDAEDLNDAAANETEESDATQRKPFVYPPRAKVLVPILAPLDRLTIEFRANSGLQEIADDVEACEHYDLLTANDIGPFTTDPDNMRVSQPWLMREARRNRMLGLPQSEQDDPRFGCIAPEERPDYPWNDTQLAAMSEKAGQWRLLLQVSIADLSQQQTEGTVYFMIPADDLARADFSRCRVSYQQT
jgi:Domain of unknown function (DUF1963)